MSGHDASSSGTNKGGTKPGETAPQDGQTGGPGRSRITKGLFDSHAKVGQNQEMLSIVTEPDTPCHQSNITPSQTPVSSETPGPGGYDF